MDDTKVIAARKNDSDAKTEKKNAYDAMRRKEKATWPGELPPKSLAAWVARKGTLLSSEEEQLWNEYYASKIAYENAVLNASAAAKELAAALAAYYASTQDDEWGFYTPDPGYLGNFHARGQITAGTDSWAGVDDKIPPEKYPFREVIDPINEPIDVDKIDLAKALELATFIDADIDGLLADGTSSLKEGEEKFTYGASYAGMQGVSISEVAGLSATYVRGKRVTWLKGDAWVCQDGDKSISSVDVGEFSSTTKVSGLSRAVMTAENAHRITTVRGAIVTATTAGADIQNVNTAAFITTLNVTGLALNYSIAGISVATTIATIANANVVAIRIFAQNFANVRVSWDHTRVSALVYDEVGISVQRVRCNVADDKMEITAKYLKKYGIQTKAISQSINSIKAELADIDSKIETGVNEIIKNKISHFSTEYYMKIANTNVTQSRARITKADMHVDSSIRKIFC